MINTPVDSLGLNQEVLAFAQFAPHHMNKPNEQQCTSTPR